MHSNIPNIYSLRGFGDAVVRARVLTFEVTGSILGTDLVIRVNQPCAKNCGFSLGASCHRGVDRARSDTNS